MVDKNLSYGEIVVFIKEQIKQECAIHVVDDTFKVLLNPKRYYQQITAERLHDDLKDLRKHAVNAPRTILWGDLFAFDQFYKENCTKLFFEIAKNTKNNIDLYLDNKAKLNYLFDLNSGATWAKEAKEWIKNLQADFEMAQRTKEFAALCEGCWSNMSLFVSDKAKLESLLEYMKPDEQVWQAHKEAFDLLIEAYKQHDAHSKREEFERLLQEGHDIIRRFEENNDGEKICSLPYIQNTLQKLLEVIDERSNDDGKTYQEEFNDFKISSKRVSEQWFEIYIKPLLAQFK